jgi:hypothetical protein
MSSVRFWIDAHKVDSEEDICSCPFSLFPPCGFQPEKNLMRDDLVVEGSQRSKHPRRREEKDPHPLTFL